MPPDDITDAADLIAALPEPQKQIFALGIFVLNFAVVENLFLQNLCVMTKVSDQFARVAMSGVRAEAAISYIRRFFEVTNAPQPEKDAYEYVFKQFKEINETRNLLLHHGIKWAGPDDTLLFGHKFVATDRARALTPAKTRTIPISSEVLNQMSQDLGRIGALLTHFHLAHEGANSWLLSDLAQHDLQRPWLYKPPPQQNQKRGKKAEAPPTPAHVQAPKRPPQSCQD